MRVVALLKHVEYEDVAHDDHAWDRENGEHFFKQVVLIFQFFFSFRAHDAPHGVMRINAIRIDGYGSSSSVRQFQYPNTPMDSICFSNQT